VGNNRLHEACGLARIMVKKTGTKMQWQPFNAAFARSMKRRGCLSEVTVGATQVRNTKYEDPFTNVSWQ
jgi:hypothetical protein